jgi:putative endonuclease
MSFDLVVDTEALRQAAERMTAAAQGYRSHHPVRLPSLPAGALGTTPGARETQELAQRRARQAFELADELATTAQDLSDRIRLVARLFDEAERAGQPGPGTPPPLRFEPPGPGGPATPASLTAPTEPPRPSEPSGPPRPSQPPTPATAAARPIRGGR